MLRIVQDEIEEDLEAFSVLATSLSENISIPAPGNVSRIEIIIDDGIITRFKN